MCRKMTENGEISQMTGLCAALGRMGYAVRMHSIVTTTARPDRSVVEQSTCSAALFSPEPVGERAQGSAQWIAQERGQ